MTAGGIVEPLDIAEHIRPGLVPGALDFAHGALGRLRREADFHRRLVPHVAGSAHATKRRQPTEPSSYRRSSASRPAGARLLFLPKYSPELGPDRSVLRQAKHRQRKAAQQSSNAVCDAIGHILKTVSAT